MIRIAQTENGTVKGLPAADPRITSFKGIPFAAPPIGENRWRAPQPCSDWEGVRTAYEFAPISVQDTPGVGDDIYCREWHVDPEIPMSEDCLYLNVWSGAKSSDEKLPVVVWFFGGTYQWGYTAEMEFDCERLARRGIVVVSVNYRLNVFGFLAHPELTSEQPDTPTNFGHLDQRAGLMWVKRNIGDFGGDSDNITIAGQSAGGASVMAQMTCPANFGLFQKAIVQSGMIKSPYPSNLFGSPKCLEQAEAEGVEFFKFIGAENLLQARKLDELFLLKRYSEYAQTYPRMLTVEDGKFCTGDPLLLYMTGKHPNVPIMTGNTPDEFVNGIFAESEEDYRNKAWQIFQDNADRFLSFNESWQFKENIGYASIDSLECTIKSVLLKSQENGGTKKCYYYKFKSDIPGWDNPGAFHSSDLWFFFETLAKCWRPFTGHHYDLARQMCNYWTNFVKTGNPNGSDNDGSPLPEWKPYSEETPCEMIFEPNGANPNHKPETKFMKFLIEKISSDIMATSENL